MFLGCRNQAADMDVDRCARVWCCAMSCARFILNAPTSHRGHCLISEYLFDLTTRNKVLRIIILCE